MLATNKLSAWLKSQLFYALNPAFNALGGNKWRPKCLGSCHPHSQKQQKYQLTYQYYKESDTEITGHPSLLLHCTSDFCLAF